ncbi:MAG: hypothetical protein P4L38_01425 [Syntrophaceae bacterium]|nr:hypothetical protein [Syntrophaceae bacterium]
MIIRCTQKLLAELKIGLMHEPSENDPFWSWHANVFHVERRKCVLITNDMTLFTMFIPGLKKPDFKSFHFVIGEHLFKNLLYENIPQPQIEAVLSQCRNMTFQKTTNRRVLGSMNDQKTQLEYLISAEGGLARTNIYELNKEVNRVTFSAINRRRPIDVLKEELRNHDE